MTWTGRVRYSLMKDVVMPVALRLRQWKKRRKRHPSPHFNPPLKATTRLKEIMTRHYGLARYAKGAHPVAWVTSGAPVELLRPFGVYTVYPENHGALCGAVRMGPELCQVAEDHGYHPDLCSYARIDLGHMLSGKTPVGRLPKPDFLLCSNNICQTVSHWYRVLAHELQVPLIFLDTPYNFGPINDADVAYMTRQLEDLVPQLERITRRSFDPDAFAKTIRIAKETSLTWGKVLGTLKARPAPMTIFDAFGHLAPVVSLRGLPVALEYYQLLLKELEERVERGVGALKRETKRLMWDNIAIWYKVRDYAELFASRGMNFVTATYTNAWAETTHFMDETRPFESMAKTYGLAILNNHLEHRLTLMEELIRDFQVDGLVIHSAKSCKPYSVGQYDLKSLLLDRLGIPSVVIEADITDFRAFSEEQANTRLNAFFETLEATG